MRSMTNQEMFDAAWNGLKAQDWQRSVREFKDVNGTVFTTECRYNGPNGLHCAFGYCLTPTERELVQEGDSARGVAKALDLDLDGTFANRLQKCHDQSQSPEDMQYRLRNLAKDYNLTIPSETSDA